MFVVVTKTSFKPEYSERVVDLALESVAIFKQQSGLVSMRVHRAHDGSHIMTYLEWESESDHLACMASSDFAVLNAAWAEILHSGHAELQLSTYEVLDGAP